LAVPCSCYWLLTYQVVIVYTHSLTHSLTRSCSRSSSLIVSTSTSTELSSSSYPQTHYIVHKHTPVCKGKGESICTAPPHEASPRRSGIARIVKGYHSFTCTLCFSSTSGMSHISYLPLPQLVLIYRPPYVGYMVTRKNTSLLQH